MQFYLPLYDPVSPEAPQCSNELSRGRALDKHKLPACPTHPRRNFHPGQQKPARKQGSRLIVAIVKQNNNITIWTQLKHRAQKRNLILHWAWTNEWKLFWEDTRFTSEQRNKGISTWFIDQNCETIGRCYNNVWNTLVLLHHRSQNWRNEVGTSKRNKETILTTCAQSSCIASIFFHRNHPTSNIQTNTDLNVVVHGQAK